MYKYKYKYYKKRKIKRMMAGLPTYYTKVVYNKNAYDKEKILYDKDVNNFKDLEFINHLIKKLKQEIDKVF